MIFMRKMNKVIALGDRTGVLQSQQVDSGGGG